MAKQSTYARLLKPGQRWYVKGDYRVYTTVKVSKLQGAIRWIKVYVKERSTPITFDDNDRVELVQNRKV